MLLYIWTLPMDVVSWILVRLTRCVPANDLMGGWVTRKGSLLDKLMRWGSKTAFTPGYSYIVFRSDVERDASLYGHELVHCDQHARYGPFFLPVYFWYSLKSKLSGTGWYWGNQLEIEARRR